MIQAPNHKLTLIACSLARLEPNLTIHLCHVANSWTMLGASLATADLSFIGVERCFPTSPFRPHNSECFNFNMNIFTIFRWCNSDPFGDIYELNPFVDQWLAWETHIQKTSKKTCIDSSKLIDTSTHPPYFHPGTSKVFFLTWSKGLPWHRRKRCKDQNSTENNSSLKTGRAKMLWNQNMPN